MKRYAHIFPRIAACMAAIALCAACGATASSATSTTKPDDDSHTGKRVKALARQDAIAVCMRAKGFEYEPFESPKGWDGPVTQEVVSNADDGYGAVLAYEKKRKGGDQQEHETYTPFQDPNQGYVSALNQRQQTAYYTALYGDMSGGGSDSFSGDEQEPQVVPLSQQGCHGQAQLKIDGNRASINSPEAAEHMNDLNEAMKNDPALAGAHQAWSACIAERVDVDARWEDFTFDDPSVMRGYVNGLIEMAQGKKPKKYDPNTNDTGKDGPWGSGPGGNFASHSFVSGPAGFGDENDTQQKWTFTGKAKPLTAKQIKELRVTELKIWNADQKCQKTYRIEAIKERITNEFLAKLNKTSTGK